MAEDTRQVHGQCHAGRTAPVQEVDRIYEATQNQRTVLEATGTAMGLVKDDDCDDARLTAILNSFTHITRRILPDGSMLVTTTRNGIVSNSTG